jgi:ribosomal-protein-alanine N-acetyltransferase
MPVRGLSIRDLHWWDVPTVHAIEQEAFPDTAWSIETFWSELAGVPETRRYWVAEDEGVVVGYAGVSVIAPDADVQTIAVSGDHRRRGVGSLLLNAAMTEARDRGCHHLMLEVAADNTSARRLYDRHGFDPIAQRSSYYGKGSDALVMRAGLPSPHEVADHESTAP